MTAPPLPGETVESLPLAAAGLSHPGQQRSENEDAFGSFVENRLFIVADGMGGHNAGEVAAAMAIDTVEGFFTSFHADPRQIWPYGVDRALSLGERSLEVTSRPNRIAENPQHGASVCTSACSRDGR